MQEIRSSNLPIITGICDPNKARARHHRSLKFGPKLKYLFIFLFFYYLSFNLSLKKYWIIRTLGIRIHQISFFKQIILLQWSNYIFCIVPPCAFKNLEGRISGPLQIPSWCVSLCGNFSLCGNSYFILLISADWVRVFRTTLCSSDQRFSRNTKHPYA